MKYWSKIGVQSGQSGQSEQTWNIIETNCFPYRNKMVVKSVQNWDKIKMKLKQNFIMSIKTKFLEGFEINLLFFYFFVE